MALSARTRRHLETAFVDDVSRSKADEVEALMASPTAMSDDLSQSLEIAMADDKAFAEVKSALETGLASLSERSGQVLEVALADEASAREIFTY